MYQRISNRWPASVKNIVCGEIGKVAHIATIPVKCNNISRKWFSSIIICPISWSIVEWNRLCLFNIMSVSYVLIKPETSLNFSFQATSGLAWLIQRTSVLIKFCKAISSDVMGTVIQIIANLEKKVCFAYCRKWSFFPKMEYLQKFAGNYEIIDSWKQCLLRDCL